MRRYHPDEWERAAKESQRRAEKRRATPPRRRCNWEHALALFLITAAWGLLILTVVVLAEKA